MFGFDVHQQLARDRTAARQAEADAHRRVQDGRPRVRRRLPAGRGLRRADRAELLRFGSC